MTTPDPILMVCIPLAPHAKRRPRVTRNGTHTDAKTVQWERSAAQHIAIAMAQQGVRCIPRATLVRMSAVFVFPRLKSAPKTKRLNRQPHGKRPDLDNLLKSLKDAMDGVAVEDDSQIQNLTAEKWYAAQGEPASVTFYLWSIE